MRVFPIGTRTAKEAGEPDFDIAVNIGLDNEKTRLSPTDIAVTFTSEGCPTGARTLRSEDAAVAAAGVLRAWPLKDGAVPQIYGLAAEPATAHRDHAAEIAAACGRAMVQRTAIVALHLTAYEDDPDMREVVNYVSCVGKTWVVWRGTR